jgi:hypothetical protein
MMENLPRRLWRKRKKKVSTEEERVRLIRARIESFNVKKEKENAREAGTRIVKEAGIIARFLTQLVKLAFWLWRWFLNPIRGVIWSWIKVVFMIYVHAWTKYVMVTDPKTEVKRMSYFRALTMIIVTLVVLTFWYPTLLLVSDSIMFVLPPTSEHNESVYLFGSSDNSFADDNWSVSGCQIVPDATEFSCDVEDSLYYRIESTWFSNLYWIFVHHNIFLPDVVGTPIAPGWNECKVNAVGIRLKLLVRNLQWYVNLLDATCKPIVVNNLQFSAKK